MFKELNQNRTRTIREGIELEHLPFIKLRELAGHSLKVDGFFFTEGRYGKQVVVVGGGMKVNMPARAVELFETIKADENLLNAVLDGKLAITNIKTAETKNGTAVLFELADIE